MSLAIKPHSTITRRRRITSTVWAIALMSAALSIADHLNAFGHGADDWTRFDHRAVRLVDAIDGDSITASTGDGSVVRVRLLGVDAPDPPAMHWAPEALKYTRARLTGRDVILRLDGTQTRDADGALRAYLYITPGDCLNADLVRDGAAYADRREHHAFAAAFEQLERDARSHKRGLWHDLRDNDQPAWRQTWLKEWLARRAAAF